ncbi:DUF2007 domain-containing protein [Idiomarina seosinensis]|uniref:putative signal transducing protein n=1 Tax=Idiomarina seosinensis TaxID=281739 RepID=UPI0038508BAC
MNDEWIVAYYAKDPIEAGLLKGLLESQSITVQMQNNGMIGGIGELPADAIETPLKVKPEDYDKAREILQAYEQEESVEQLCNHCHEINFSNFELCWNCGKVLV